MEEEGKEKGKKGVQRRSEGRGREEIRERGREVVEWKREIRKKGK
jgi:hypothetical protein